MNEIDKTALYQKAISTYGTTAQINKACEELFELGAAIHHFMLGKITTVQLADEVADVEIMIEQLKEIIGCESSIKLCKYNKLKRLDKKLQG